MNPNYRKFSEIRPINSIEDEELPGSEVTNLRTVDKHNRVVLAEVHKLFELANFIPQKTTKVPTAAELAEKFKGFAQTSITKDKRLAVTIESGGKKFVYVGLPTYFYEKYFQYFKFAALDKKEKL